MNIIELSTENHIAIITMNDHAHRNRFSASFSSHMLKLFNECERSDCRAVIIRANDGEKVWSAGHDIGEFPTDQKTDPFPWEEPYNQLTRAIRYARFPVICAVQGSVWGAGCDLAACSDFVIATPDATFAVTPAKLGLPHSLVGITNFIRAFPDHMLKEIFMLAKPIAAETAHRFGFVNRLVEPDNLHDQAIALAQDLAANSPRCIAALKAEMRMLQDAVHFTSHQAEEIQSLRRRVYQSSEITEGLAAFHEKRPPEFTGE